MIPHTHTHARISRQEMSKSHPNNDRPTAQRSLFQTPSDSSDLPESNNPVSNGTTTDETSPDIFENDNSSGASRESAPATDDTQTGTDTTTTTPNAEADTIAQLRAQISRLNDQMLRMSNQRSPAIFSPGSSAFSMQFSHSREYWARPIQNTIYPGEDAQFSSKRT